MDTPPPHVQLIQMATAHWASRLLYVAAKLDLADRVAAGPKSAETLAEETGTHAPSLHRVLRTLASLGLFVEDEAHRFATTPLGEALRADAPGAAHATALTLGGDWVWKSFGEILYSVQTGEPAAEKALGEPIFDWLAKHPEQASLFTKTMVGFHGAESVAVAAAYDFSGFRTVVDVGGASGNLVTAVLERHPGPRGILFDLPHVVRESAETMRTRSVADRVEVRGGSFFEAVPEGADAYLLSHVIHDWSEEQCLKILGNCRKAMKPEGRVLIIEMVLPEGGESHPGKMLDIMMLVGPGGRERTAPEYRELLKKAGFRMTKVVPTDSAVSIVEAARA